MNGRLIEHAMTAEQCLTPPAAERPRNRFRIRRTRPAPANEAGHVVCGPTGGSPTDPAPSLCRLWWKKEVRKFSLGISRVCTDRCPQIRFARPRFFHTAISGRDRYGWSVFPFHVGQIPAHSEQGLRTPGAALPDGSRSSRRSHIAARS